MGEVSTLSYVGEEREGHVRRTLRHPHKVEIKTYLVKTALYLDDFLLFFSFFFLKILFIHERQRERERERQRHRRREKQAPHKEPDVGLDPGSSGSRPGPKAALNC